MNANWILLELALLCGVQIYFVTGVRPLQRGRRGAPVIQDHACFLDVTDTARREEFVVCDI